MKKLLVLALVLAVSTMASAGIVKFQVAADDAKATYNPGEVITIEIVDIGGNVTGVSIGNIEANGGSAAAGLLPAGFINFSFHTNGTVVNADGVLINKINGSLPFGAGSVASGAPIYTFEYTTGAEGEYTISATDDAASFTNVGITEDPYASVASIESLGITVVPEPITVALLGLGGLFIRRRK